MWKFLRNSILVSLGIVAIFSFGLWVAYHNQPAASSNPVANQALPSLTVQLLIDDGDVITGYRDLKTIPEASVLTVLEQVATQHNLKLDIDRSYSLGAFIKQIGAKKNGTGQKYWQYWVGGVQPLVAADKYELKGGETILWTFRKSAL